jgi:hypothetical protein
MHVSFHNGRKISWFVFSDVRQLAFQLALKKKSEHSLPVDKGMAGRKWLIKFPYLSSSTFIAEARIHVFGKSERFH